MPSSPATASPATTTWAWGGESAWCQGGCAWCSHSSTHTLGGHRAEAAGRLAWGGGGGGVDSHLPCCLTVLPPAPPCCSFRLCPSDEHYIPTLLAYHNKSGECDCSLGNTTQTGPTFTGVRRGSCLPGGELLAAPRADCRPTPRTVLCYRLPGPPLPCPTLLAACAALCAAVVGVGRAPTHLHP